MCECCMIDEFDARGIASEWHGGQFTPLYAFSSSGHMDATTTHDAESTRRKLTPGVHNAEEVAKLDSLVEWLTKHAPGDTSEDDSTDHDFEVCPDCGNGGIIIGANGYENCTRFRTCWSDN